MSNFSREDVIHAIYGQESSSGAADTSQENYAGARGPMQVTKPTFEGLKKIGLIPNDWTHDNEKQTKEAGNRLVGYLYDKYDGDPSKVAAAYYAGEKAVRPDGTITNFRDLKNPKAPTTHQYVADIMSRLGAGSDDSTDESAPDAPAGTMPGRMSRANVMASWDTPMPERNRVRERKPYESKATVQIPEFSPISGLGVIPEADRIEAVEQNLRKAQAERDNTSFLDVAQAAFGDTFGGAAMRSALRPEYQPDPGFHLDPKRLNGMTEAEQDFMREAQSEQHAQRIEWEIQDNRDRHEVMARKGPVEGFAASMLAGLPEGYITGFGAARSLQFMKLGSLELAAQGQRGAAIASSLAENVGGNLALTAGQSQFDPYVGATDFGMAAGMGILGTVMHSPTVFKEASKFDAIREAHAVMENAARQALELRRQAIKNLGADASPEALMAEVKRLESNGIRQELAAGKADTVPENRKLLPEMAEPGVESTPMDFPSLDSGVADKRPYLEGVDIARAGEVNPTNAMDRETFSTIWGSHEPVRWADRPGVVMSRHDRLMEIAGGVSRDQMAAMPNGVHEVGGTKLSDDQKFVLDYLHKTFLPESKILVQDLNADATVPANRHGDATRLWDEGYAIRFRADSKDWQHTLIHEVGHAILTHKINEVPARFAEGFKQLHAEWQQRYRGAEVKQTSGEFPNRTAVAMERGNITGDYVHNTLGFADREDGFEQSMMDVMAGVIDKVTGQQKNITAQARQFASKYIPNFDEFGAEQFVKYVEAAVADKLDWKPASMPKAVVDYFRNLWDNFKALFEFAKKNDLIAPDTRATEFFESIRKQAKASNTKEKRIAQGLNPERDTMPSAAMALPPESAEAKKLHTEQEALTNDPIAQKYGFHMLPVKTPQERAEFQALIHLYKRAEELAPTVDESRLSKLMNTSVFENGQSTANTLLRSGNPVARMIAGELLENPSGAGGRKSSAAIHKYMKEHEYLGNTMNDVQGLYNDFRKAQGGSVIEDTFGGKNWQQFNRLIAEEIESRRPGAAKVESPPAVIAAADKLEAAYERMRSGQIAAKSAGWAALPESSVGYMPHKMDPAKVLNMTDKQHEALHSALTDQFIGIEGFDPTFADHLASKYVDRVRRKALGGYSAPANIHHTGAADIVQEALEAMGMSKEEVQASMERYMRAGPAHTKKRLQLDLGREYPMEDGSSFKLMDLFDTDQFNLLRSQAQRVSGEVALARHGVMGKSGLDLIRRAIEFGPGEARAKVKALEAYDQVAAEFLGSPYGTQSRMLDRVMQVNSLARLGGMGFTQLGESLNGLFHVGAIRTLDSIASMPRLRSEILRLAKGEKVENPILHSLEEFGGAEFGAEAYKTVFPFDNSSRQYQTYGKETLTAADRLLRGGAHVQAKLSMWRAIHSTQQRGFAEQIVRKAAQYLRDGGNDVALRDMGISDDLLKKLREDLPNIAEFDHNGKLTNFDITKAKDVQSAEDFTQAIHRGVSQIIQGTFIGERSKWAHDSVMRLMTQFRTFSLTSVEKQWARQVGNVGHAKALGMMLGSMSLAAPLYMARTYLNSVGMGDKQAEYLEKQLTPMQIARASMNYVAMSGLAGDLMDATTAVSGVGQVTGGRTSAGTSFVGNVVAPAAGLADDVWKGVQNTKDGTDPTQLVKSLPFSRVPGMIQLINTLGH